MPERYQSYDELSSGTGAAPGSIEEATRVAERRARVKTRQAAETLHEQSPPQGEVLATPGGTAAARERVSVYTAPARSAGERITEAVHYVRTGDKARFAADAKEFIRQHPASLAGAALAGYVFGRILRRL